MSAYYNENNKFSAQWLRNLIDAGEIAPGVVDDRSILDVRANDLDGFTQCHFFAGIGVWSHALRRAGWADDRPVWTGSCPCQPFSVAGKGGGHEDERHLWPAWFRLIRERRPPRTYGEQVASSDGLAWLDVVSTDMEGAGYAIGSADLCAAGVGAPHIRQRLFFVGTELGAAIGNGALADTECKGLQARPAADLFGEGRGSEGRQPGQSGDGGIGRLADADGRLLGEAGDRDQQGLQRGGQQRLLAPSGGVGFWSEVEWIACRDGKSRPVEPGTAPLAAWLAPYMGRLSARQRRLAEMAGLDAVGLARAKAYRVGTMMGYGNAIVADAAELFVRATL